jgi:hypothetical protein
MSYHILTNPTRYPTLYTSSKNQKWHSTLHNKHLHTAQDQPVRELVELEGIIEKLIQEQQTHITLMFSTDKHYGIHPTFNIPILHWDQLNAIANISAAVEKDLKTEKSNDNTIHGIDHADIKTLDSVSQPLMGKTEEMAKELK